MGTLGTFPDSHPVCWSHKTKMNDQHESEAKRKALVRTVNAQKAFNLPLYEVFFVIDCREASKYAAGHIASAMNFPPPASFESKDLCLARFVQYASNNFCNDRWDPIVVYGDSSREVVEHMTWVVQRLLDFIQSPTIQDGDWFMKCMSQHAQNIWVIECGYEGFTFLYPPLNCISDESGAGTMIPLPYHVASDGKGLFIGSRAIEWTKQLIEAMKIQSVVLDKPGTKVFDSEQLSTPLEYFLCSISNSDEEDETDKVTIWSRNRLENLFDLTTEFIQKSLSNDRRVLIQLRGRSESAAIAIAWHMRYKHLPFEDARAAVFASTLRNPVDASSSVLNKALLFEKELRLWERSAKFATYA